MYNIFGGNKAMEYNVKCPNCDAEQKHLSLDEKDGSFVCSKCGAQTKINMEKLKKVTLKKETAN